MIQWCVHMSQHFLLSAQARTLSIKRLYEMNDEDAFQFFKELRWGTSEKVVCPHCGTVNTHYFIKTRHQWRCKDCHRTFSVTSGTVFAFHKLPIKLYLIAIAIFTNAVKGLSALQLSRDLDVQYKTAFVLAHKIRESLMEQRDDSQPLEGEIHMDGAYVNTHVRPENKKEKRIDRRLAKNQKESKRCIFVIREKDTDPKQQERQRIRGKVRTYIIKVENQDDVKRLAEMNIKRGAIVCADESNAYDLLHAKYEMHRVNHQVEYMADDGTTNNMAESYFSRFRRMQIGQVHKFGLLYLANYANEAAYREDMRRCSNGEIFGDILRKCIGTFTHHDWCGYWQGNKRLTEKLATL